MKWPFRTLIALVFVLCHLQGIEAPPNGFHKWRETDTATVAENYANEGMKFLMPRVNVRGTGDGIVGMELPVYNYASALLYEAFGFSHAWPRLLSLVSGLALLFGIHAMTKKLTGNDVTARIAMLLSACSPLVAFYSVKIQPDVLGLALTVWGFVHFLAWTDSQSKRRLLATVAFLALAGSIKPTFLFVGLPMAFVLWTERDTRLWASPTLWLAGVAILAPVAGWLSYARALSERFGSSYFYLGGDLQAEMRGLASGQFYQNTLLTWPWEMALGIPGLILLLLGFKGRTSGWNVMGAWMVGSFVVFALAATHCATPHDYYYLPAVPALIFLAATPATWLIERPKGWQRAVAGGLLIMAPVYGYGRIQKRFDFRSDFTASRAFAASIVDSSTLVVAVDKIPGDLLYRTGLKGWRVEPPVSDKDLARFASMGAKYVVTAAEAGSAGPGFVIRPLSISLVQVSTP